MKSGGTRRINLATVLGKRVCIHRYELITILNIVLSYGRVVEDSGSRCLCGVIPTVFQRAETSMQIESIVFNPLSSTLLV
jgi:hypothetical protein